MILPPGINLLNYGWMPGVEGSVRLNYSYICRSTFVIAATSFFHAAIRKVKFSVSGFLLEVRNGEIPRLGLPPKGGR